MAKKASFLENPLPHQYPSQNARIPTFTPLFKMTIQKRNMMKRSTVHHISGLNIHNPRMSKFAPTLNNQLRTWMMRLLAPNTRVYTIYECDGELEDGQQGGEPLGVNSPEAQ